MALKGSLGTIDKVSTKRPLIVLTAGIGEAATGYTASHAIASHAAMIASDRGQVPAGVAALGLWLLVTLALGLWVFITPGRFKFSRADRGVLDDELVNHHRALAYRAGFITLAVLVLAAALGSVFGSLAPWWPVAALSASLLVSAVVFASMELRANA